MSKFGNLYVSSLSVDTTEEILLKYFSQFGIVIHSRIFKNQPTGRSCGFGFVTFKDSNCIHTVLNSAPHEIDGQLIVCQHSRQGDNQNRNQTQKSGAANINQPVQPYGIQGDAGDGHTQPPAVGSSSQSSASGCSLAPATTNSPAVAAASDVPDFITKDDPPIHKGTEKKDTESYSLFKYPERLEEYMELSIYSAIDLSSTNIGDSGITPTPVYKISKDKKISDPVRVLPKGYVNIISATEITSSSTVGYDYAQPPAAVSYFQSSASGYPQAPTDTYPPAAPVEQSKINKTIAADFKAEMQALEKNLTRLKKGYAALENKVKELSSHESHLKEKLELTEKEKEEVTSDLKAENDARQSLESSVSELNDQIKSLKEELAGKSLENVELKKTCENLKTDFKAEMQALKTNLTKLKKDNAALESKVEELSSHESHLKEKLELTEKEKEEVTSDLKAENDARQSLESHTSVSELNDQIKSLKEELAGKSLENVELKKRCESLETEFKLLI